MSQYFRHGAGANGTETSGLLQIPVLQTVWPWDQSS